LWEGIKGRGNVNNCNLIIITLSSFLSHQGRGGFLMLFMNSSIAIPAIFCGKINLTQKKFLSYTFRSKKRKFLSNNSICRLYSYLILTGFQNERGAL